VWPCEWLSLCVAYLTERKAGEEDSEVSERGINRRLTKIAC